jgi:hypothetical protein
MSNLSLAVPSQNKLPGRLIANNGKQRPIRWQSIRLFCQLRSSSLSDRKEQRGSKEGWPSLGKGSDNLNRRAEVEVAL